MTFAFWASALAWATFLSPRLESLLDGTPNVIIRDYEFWNWKLQRNWITASEVEWEMRLVRVDHVRDVA